VNAATVTAAIVAAVAVLGALLSMARLSYLIGHLVGRVESVITQGNIDRARVDGDIARLTASLAMHENNHRRAGR
jgi:hypothetical protein